MTNENNTTLSHRAVSAFPMGSNRVEQHEIRSTDTCMVSCTTTIKSDQIRSDQIKSDGVTGLSST